MMTRPKNRSDYKKLFTLLLLVLSSGAFATTYYVSSTGNDANAGTSKEAAWGTVSKVNSSVFLPGDKLFFEGGKTFNGSIYLNSSDANNAGNIFVIS